MTDDLEEGCLAVDQDYSKSGLLIVVNVTETSASEYVLFETPGNDPDVTVDFYNSDYPMDDLVVEAVYIDELPKRMPPREAFERFRWGDGVNGVTKYSFPQSRLQRPTKESE